MVRRLALIATILMFSVVWAAGALAQEQPVDLGLITVKQKDLADKIHRQLLQGGGFESLAEAHSVGPAASQGGRLGKVPYNRLRTEYKQALQGLPLNTPSAVIPTEEGFTILMPFGEKPRRAAAAAPAPSQPSYLAARQSVMAGMESLAAGDWKLAEKNISQALTQNPQDENAPFFLEMLREAQAGKIKKNAVQSFAGGFVSMLAGDAAEAQKKFRQALAQDSRFWQALLVQASLNLSDPKKDSETQQNLRKVLTINPKSAQAHVYLGLLALGRGRTEEGKKELEEAARLNPKLAEPHYQLASLALAAKDLKTAEQNLRAAIAADPYKEEAYNDLGIVLAETNRPQEAEKAYLRTLELNPGFAAAHSNLGELYARHGQVNRAIQEFEKALTLDPEMPQAHVNLALAYVQKEEWAQAIAHAEAAQKMKIPLPEALLEKLKPHQR